jgi:hypothetical protein
VAGRGVVREDQREPVEFEVSEVVDAAADPLALAAAGACVAAVGMVPCDRAVFEPERCRGVVVEASAEAVAAVTPVAAIAAEGVVVADGGSEDECGAGVPEAAAQAVAGAGAGTGRTPLGLVAGDGTSLDRENRRSPEVRRVGGGRSVVEAAAETVAAVAPLSLIVGQRAAVDVDDAPEEFATPPPERPRRAADRWLFATVLSRSSSCCPRRRTQTGCCRYWRARRRCPRHDGAGGVAVAADGAVVTDRHVVEGSGSRGDQGDSLPRWRSPAGSRRRRTGSWRRPRGCRCPLGPRCLEEAIGDRSRFRYYSGRRRTRCRRRRFRRCWCCSNRRWPGCP